MNIGQLIASLAIDYSQLQQAQAAMQNFGNVAERQIGKVQKQLDSASRSLKQFGGDATRSLTIPLALVGGASANVFKSYETTLAHIQGLTGSTAQQTKEWDTQMKSLSVSVAKSPQELAEAMYFIASSGIEASKAFSILKSSAEASAAGLGTTQQVANLVTSAMNAYAKSGLTASISTDILTAAVREGKIEATQFADHVGYVIPIAAELGVSFDQVAAAMAAMSTTGADASTSATQLRQLLSDILKPAHQSEVALKQFGSSGAELREILQSQGLLATLDKIRDMMQRFGKEAVAKVFPEVRALTGVLMLMGQNAEHVAEIFKEVAESSGDMQYALSVVQNTLEFKYNQSLSQARLSLIEFGEAMKGPLIAILQSFSNTLHSITSWFSHLSDTSKRYIIVATSILAVIGPTMYMIGSLIGVVRGLITAYKGLSIVMITLKTTMQGLAVFMAANPYLAIATAIAVVASAFLMLKNKVNDATDAQKRFNDEKERTKQLDASMAGISEQMLVIDQLNKAQLGSLKSTVEMQLNQLQSASAEYLGKAKKTFEDSKNIASKAREELFKKSASGKGPDNAAYSKQVMEFAKMNEEFKKIDAEKSTAQAKSYKDQINHLEGFLKIISTKLKNFKDKNDHDPGKADSIIAEMIRQEQIIANKTAVMGMAFNTNKELTKLYEKTLNDLLEAGLSPLGKEIETVKGKWEKVNPVMANADAISKGLIDTMVQLGFAVADMSNMKGSLGFDKDMSKQVTILENLSAELDGIAIQHEILGTSYDDISAKASVYLSTLIDLKKLHTTSADAEASKLTVMYKQAAQLEKMITLYKSMGEEISSALQNGAASWKEFGESVKSVIRNVITALIAKSLTEAITNAIGTASSMGPYGYLLIPALVGSAVGLANTAINQIPGFAEGGVVPPGYPNDTYLARLTSGETIVPPGDMTSIQNQNEVTKLKFDFRMSGRELRAILMQEEKIISKA